MTSAAEWFIRPVRVTFGVGTRDDAATFTVTLDLPEWIGAYGDEAAWKEREAQIDAAAIAQVAPRFTSAERIVVIKREAIANRVRPSWDR